MIITGRSSVVSSPIGPFSAPGYPGVDYVVGRTSTNDLKKAVTTMLSPVAGFSSSSVTIGSASGSRVFVFDSSISAFAATDNITVCVTGDTTSFIKGVVTSVVGTTLTMTATSVGGSGTYSSWSLRMHLPANVAQDGVSPINLRTGSTSGDFTIADWDFRGTQVQHYIQNNKHVLYSQCLFDFSAMSFGSPTVSVGSPYMGVRSASGGQPSFSCDHCTFDCSGSSIPLMLLGSNLVNFKYNKVIGTPTDFWSGAPNSALGPVTTEMAYNDISIGATADASTLLHADGIQMTGYVPQTLLSIHHNKIVMPNGTPPGGVGVTGIFNLGSTATSWNTPVEINNVDIRGGAYTMFLYHVAAMNAPFTFGDNVYVSGAAFGPVYPGQTLNITSATKANPCVITTSAAHGFVNGQPIYIKSVGGMTQLNGQTYVVANKTSTTFELSGIDSTGYTTYTSGGNALSVIPQTLTIQALKDPVTGLPQPFYNKGSMVYSIP